MNDSKRYEIAVLADDVHTKRLIYEAHGLGNTPTDPGERRKAAIAYEIAKAEYYEAMALLAIAQTAVPQAQ